MSDELNENMTSEEIKAYAESVIQEVEQDRQGETKSDAEIVVNTSAPIKTPAEERSGSDTVEGKSSNEESGSTSKVADWVTDDVKAEVAVYGIEESDLEDFATREDLDRALRLLDKAAIQAGRQALEESEVTTRNEKGQFTKKEALDSEEPSEETRQSDKYEVALSPDLYDDEIIGEFERMRDHYESRLKSLESRFAETSAQAEEQQFDSFVDSMGHADLFGKTGSESQKELDRRRDLLLAVKAQAIGLERLGRPTEITDQLVARVANMVFADELSKKRLKQQTSKMSKQSNLRLGGSPTKPQSPSDDPREEADRLFKELERA